MASKHRVLIPPAWPSRLAESSSSDLKTAATPPAISSPEYVSKLEASLIPEETASLKELNPNEDSRTLSDARRLARSSSTAPSPATALQDRENSSKRSSSSDIPPERANIHSKQDSTQSSRVQNRVCLDPQMYRNQSHSEAHHPGLVPLGDFCDSGVEAAPEMPIETPEMSLLDRFWHGLDADDNKGQPTQLQSNLLVNPQGRVFRALTGGDICVEPVDVSGHFHGGHAPISKVRPAPGVPLSAQLPHHGHSGVSKVRPLVNDTLQLAPADETKPSDSQRDPSTPIQDNNSTEQDQRGTAPFVQRGQSSVEQAQPFQEGASNVRPQEGTPIADINPASLIKHEPSNYWGFSTQASKPEEASPKKDNVLPVGIISPVKPTDEYGPLRPSSQDNALRPLDRDEHLRHLSKDHNAEGHGPIDLTRGTKESNAKSWTHNRTSRWLRDLLQYPDPYSPRLTQLPHKSSGRRNTVSIPGNARPSGQNDPVSSRTLTRHSVDNIYKSTFNDLERIVNGAVQLAKEAVEQFEYQPNKGPGRAGKRKSHRRTSISDYGDVDSLQEGPYRGSEHHDSGENLVSGLHRHKPARRHSTIVVPIPQRISSLLRLGEISDKQGRRTSLGQSAINKSIHFPLSSPNPGISHDDTSPIRHVSHEDRVFQEPSIHQRENHPNPEEAMAEADVRGFEKSGSIPRNHCTDRERLSLDGTPSDVVDFSTQHNLVQAAANNTNNGPSRRLVHTHTAPPDTEYIELQELDVPAPASQRPSALNLRGRSHVSLRGYQGFSLARSQPRQPIARDWSDARKRYVASVACISTALIGVLAGIYAGLVPSIQYYIVDLSHYALLGNVVFYFGLAIPSFFFWPLPLLHGRKPYILSGLAIAMPLLFPQAISVSQMRSPYISQWRWALLAPRGFMGLALGFASMNFHSILTDLFGASLMSGNPHQEVVDDFDVRRHGGGMGVWLGIWTWCFTGSLGIGFLIGASVINSLNPSWGFYISIVLIVVVLILNVFCPEVRRSAYRRSVVEVRKGTDVSRRLARGEVMMHRVKDGPKWWGQEVYHGILLSLEMLRQPGFAIIAVYTGWIYAQVVLIIVLLGSLTSRSYLLRSPLVGTCVAFISIGALAAVPFQKANLFSRGRHHQGMTNELTMVDKQLSWTSHLLRRAIFCIVLPLAGFAYTMSSGGSPVPVEVPVLFAAVIGHLSGLAMSECNGLIMETFDTSDLQPGMTGRPRAISAKHQKRTNYSSFPRATAGLACSHTFGFIFAAGATALGGTAQRDLGQRAATGMVAGILFVLTLLLLAVLIRFKNVQIIPDSKKIEMEKWTNIRRESIRRRSVASVGGKPGFANTMTEEEMWRPVILGNPSSKERRVNVLELGHLSRWTEIRKRNRLIDEGNHLNRAALESARNAVVEEAAGIGAKAAGLVRSVSSRSVQRNNRGGTPKPTETFDERATGTKIPNHRHTPGAGEGFSERECVMGQTLSEEDEDVADDEAVIGLDEEDTLANEDDNYMKRDHASHMTNKVQNARQD